jgi:hypothetical protein
MPSFVNLKASAGHVFSDEIGKTSILTKLKVTPHSRRRLCRVAHIKRPAERIMPARWDNEHRSSAFSPSGESHDREECEA